MDKTEIFRGVDHVNRQWLITASPRRYSGHMVTFTCWNVSGRKALDKRARWHPDTGWDRYGWFPAAPRPVPEDILSDVEKKLQELAQGN